MKTVASLLLISLTLFIASCDKEDSEGPIFFAYEATVISEGIDCGDTYLIDLTGLESDPEFDEGIYYANNLPEELKKANLKIKLNCRPLREDEIYACTCLGPGFGHVFVEEAEEVSAH
jgi:hypothetical protein